MHRFSISLASLAVLALGGQALGFQVYSTIQNEVFAANSGVSPTKLASKAFIADVSGHGSNDVFVLFSDELCQFYAPGGLKLALLSGLSFGVLDACPLPPAPGSSQARIAGATAGGLFVWSLHKSTGVWSNVKLTGPDSVHWNGASMLRCGDVDGNGIEDLVGIRSDHRGVIIGYGNAQGGFDTQLGPSFAQDLLDFAIGDVDGDSQLEFGGVQMNGFSVRELNGTPTAFARATVPGYCAATVRRVGQPDQFAWFTRDALSNDTVLWMINGSSFEPSINLGSHIVRAATVGDYDGDGNDDLMVSHTNWSVPTLYRRLAGLPSYGTGPTEAFNVDFNSGLAAPLPGPCTALGDLDGDGLLEAAGFIEATRALRIARRDPIPPPLALTLGDCVSLDNVVAGVNYKSTELAEGADPTWSWSSATNELELIVDKAGWPAFANPVGHSDYVNAFEVYAYKQVSPGTGSMTVSTRVRLWGVFSARSTAQVPQNVNTLYPTATNPNTSLHLLKIPLTHPVSGNPVDMPQMDWSANGADFPFYFEIRACYRDPNTGQISRRKRMYKYGLSGTSTSGSTTTTQLFGFLAGLPYGEQLPFNCSAYEAGHSNGSGATVKIGGFVSLSSLPTFESLPMEYPLEIYLVGTF